MRSIPIFLISVLLSCATTPQISSDGYGHSAQRLGYRIGGETRLPEKEEIPGKFRVSITRDVGNPVHRRLIELAESVYPSPEKVISTSDRSSIDRENQLVGELLWWDGDFDGVRIPYAITGRAVQYYLDLSTSFQHGDVSRTGITMLSSNFRYSAKVEQHAQFQYGFSTFEKVSVVRLSLVWSNYCGELCALWIDKERVVVFDHEQNLIAILGDGHYSPMVS